MTEQIKVNLPLPDSARVWVYQAERKLTKEEKADIHQQLTNFTDQWKSHGAELATGFDIVLDQFIVLGVDESQSSASGCSIDSSVRILKELEQKLGITLLDKSKVAYLQSDKVHTVDFRAIKEEVTSGSIKIDTLIFNNHIQTKEELATKWVITANESWLSRFFD